MNSNRAETPGKNSIHAETTRTLQHPCRNHFGMFLRTAIFTAILPQFTAIFSGGTTIPPPPPGIFLSR